MAFSFTYDDVIEMRVSNFLYDYGFQKFFDNLGVDINTESSTIMREFEDSTWLYEKVYSYVTRESVYFNRKDIKEGLDYGQDYISESDVNQVEDYLAHDQIYSADKYLLRAVTQNYLPRAIANCVCDYKLDAQQESGTVSVLPKKVEESQNKTAWKYNNMLRG